MIFERRAFSGGEFIEIRSDVRDEVGDPSASTMYHSPDSTSTTTASGTVPRPAFLCIRAWERATASGTLAITKWTFTATDPNIGSVNSSQTSATWSGAAVASGGVTVQGTINGVSAASDTGRISVTPRPSGWSWSADKSSGMSDFAAALSGRPLDTLIGVSRDGS